MVASSASNTPQTPANQPQSAPLTTPPPPGGTAADSPHPTSDIAHPTFRSALSPADAALLSAILTHNLDLPAFACITNLDLATLLDFADRPDIKPRIESYQRLRVAAINDKSLTLTANTRIDAIQQLSDLIPTLDNPIEKRRAIDLLLRHTAIATTPHSRRTTACTNPRASSPSHPPTPSPTHSPSSSPPPPHPPIPTPPHSSAEALATHIENLLTPDQKTPETLIPALHACFAPRARLNKFPVPTDPSAFTKSIHPDVTKLLCLPATLIERTTKATGPNSHTESLWLIPHRGPQYIVTLTLARETTESPWQLHTLDTT